MSDTENNKNIKKLKEIFQSKRNKMGVFVGAGASAPLGIRTWKEILYEMAEQFSVDIDIEKSINSKGYPETASAICNQINNYDYLNFMKQQFEPTNCNFTSLHLKIIDIFRAIFTTNYDSSFENVFNNSNTSFNVQKFPVFDPFTLYSNPSIVYLHGNNDENKYIFKKEEYETYYPSISRINGSDELEIFLKEILSKINLVFIGFSFNDLYFKEFLKKVLKELIKESDIHRKVFNLEHPRNPVNHFVLLPDDRASNIDEVRDMGLRVILYEKDRHVEIETVLNELKLTKLGRLEEAAYGK